MTYKKRYKPYPKLSEINCCPYCGSEEYYTREKYSGTCDFYERFDGRPTENRDMYEYAEHRKISKFAFCSDCRRKIAKIEGEY